jgi:hypothetical protein
MDVDSIEFDREVRRVRIPLYERCRASFFKRILGRVNRNETFRQAGYLILDEVRDLHITDTARIGYYDIVAIDYLEEEGTVEFRTGCPVSVTLEVSSFCGTWVPGRQLAS